MSHSKTAFYDSNVHDLTDLDVKLKDRWHEDIKDNNVYNTLEM